MEYAGALVFGLVVFCLIAVTIRAQFKNKGSCACGGSPCGGACSRTSSNSEHAKNTDKNDISNK